MFVKTYKDVQVNIFFLPLLEAVPSYLMRKNKLRKEIEDYYGHGKVNGLLNSHRQLNNSINGILYGKLIVTAFLK